MKRNLTTAGLLAATAALAACSGETAEPLTNEEAVVPILEQTLGKTPTQLLERMASNFYPTFELAKGLGGDRAEAWDEAKFKSELTTAFAPLSEQVDAAFAAHVASEMEDGEGQQLLDMLAEGKNAEFAACVFNSESAEQGNRFASCKASTGAEAPQEFQDALGDLAGRMGRALQGDETMAVAVGYATCSVLAKFGNEVSTDNLTINLQTTELGISAEKKPCTDYDALAAETFTGEVAPNFPAEETEGTAAE